MKPETTYLIRYHVTSEITRVWGVYSSASEMEEAIKRLGREKWIGEPPKFCAETITRRVIKTYKPVRKLARDVKPVKEKGKK